MNVQHAICHIIEKTQFYDFDFTDEFIEMIKANSEYDGLYDILDLCICKKFDMKKNLWKEIITSNPYPLVNQIINIYNLNYTIFQFEEKNDFITKTLDSIYDEINKIFEEKKDNSEIHTNILILLLYNLEIMSLHPHKYIEHPIIQKCIEFANIQKISMTRNIIIIKKETDVFETKYPGVATSWIKYITTRIQMSNDKQDIKQIANCSNILFPNKQMAMYNDILYFMCIIESLHRMRLEKKYDYIDYIIDIPPYDNFTYMFSNSIQIIRLTFELGIKKDNSNYISYLKNLLENKNKFLCNTTFTDYMCCLNINCNYTEVYNTYIKYKKYIMHTIKSQTRTILKLNLICMIINSGYQTNKNISKKEFNEILENIKADDYVDNGITKDIHKRIGNFINDIEKRNNKITSLGFDIVDRPKDDETCLICQEDIDDTNTETVRCICCKKELGHINCVCIWIKNKQTCPNCRSSVEQRILMRE